MFAFFGGLMLTAFSMPLSHAGMSIGQFTMAGGWLLCNDLQGRIKGAIKQPVWWLLTGLFLLHLIGLWNTSDFVFAVKDLRVKLPLLLMPLLMGSGPELTLRQIRQVMWSLLAGVLASTLSGYIYYLWQPLAGQLDYRSLSRYISHIRLSLLIDVSLIAALYFISESKTLTVKLILIVAIVWLLYFLVLLQSITGLGILAILLMAGVAWMLFCSSALWLRVVSLMMLSGGFYTSYYLYRYIFIESIEPAGYVQSKAPTHTARGRAYQFDPTRQAMENGRLVWVEYNEAELDSAWQRRSLQGLWANDQQGHMQLITLMRYLTWKGYLKDADGVAKLSHEEVKQIEQGFATPEEANPDKGLGYRLRMLASEYRQYYYEGWAAGHSLAQRLEFWKAALHIIEQHPMYGVGTGDLPSAYVQAYKEIKTTLTPEWRLRAHNQYLSMAVAFGWPGLAYFTMMLAVCFIIAFRRGDLFYLAFLIIASVSFINEDTLETQAGVTFFAFLNAYFLFIAKGRFSQKQEGKEYGP
jgi:hypothetical protein